MPMLNLVGVFLWKKTPSKSLGKIWGKEEKSESDFLRGLQVDFIECTAAIRIDMLYVWTVNVHKVRKFFFISEVFKVEMMPC